MIERVVDSFNELVMGGPGGLPKDVARFIVEESRKRDLKLEGIRDKIDQIYQRRGQRQTGKDK